MKSVNYIAVVILIVELLAYYLNQRVLLVVKVLIHNYIVSSGQNL